MTMTAREQKKVIETLKKKGLMSEEEMATYRESMKSPNYPYE